MDNRELNYYDEESEYLDYSDENSEYLEHYGIKGMKWGVRRFQNKDGSLTKAGLKRYSEAAGKAIVEGGKKLGEAAGKAAQATKEKISEHHAQRKEEKRIEKLMSKPIRKLTEEERIERMDRKMKEKELLSLEKNVKELDAGAISKGRKFAEDMVTKVAIPAVLNAGEKQLTAFLNKKLGDALGLGDKDTNLISEVLGGSKQLKDLTDGQINKIGKAAESWGNVNKFIFGKNSENSDAIDTGTLYRDLMSGKKKMEDLVDGEVNKAGKLFENASNVKKQVAKDQPETETKPKNESKTESKTETKSELKSEVITETEVKPKTESESKPKTETSNRTDFGNYKMKSVEEMSSYTPVKTAKSLVSKVYDSGYKMKSVEDIEKSSQLGFGESYAVRQLYSSGYRMAPLNDK